MTVAVTISTLCLCFVLSSVSPAQSRGWRGIVPLHSKRGDVERILGMPERRISEYSVLYRTAKETVLINYSEGLPCGIGEKYSLWRVPKDTVENILVTPTRPVTLSDLGIDESKFEKRQGGHLRDDVYYINEQTGENLRVFLNEVRSITYYPGTSDLDLLCPEVPKPVNCTGLAPQRFGSYRDIDLQKENSRLDNFSIALKDESNRTGYIIAYAGKRARVGEAKARAERAKKYLVRTRNLKSDQIQAIDGGYREEAEVELFVVPSGTCAPSVTPTIDPRDVTITRTMTPTARRRL